MSLIARLCLLVLVAMLPVLAIQLHHELELRRQGEEHVRAEALRLARFAAGEMDRIIESARVFLLALSHHPAVRQRYPAACSAYLAPFDGMPGLTFGGIVAADATGRPFCASVALPPGLTIADRGYFREAMATGRLAVGGFVVSRLDGRWSLPVAMPFADADEDRAGVVALGISLDWLGNYFKVSKRWLEHTCREAA